MIWQFILFLSLGLGALLASVTLFIEDVFERPRLARLTYYSSLFVTFAGSSASLTTKVIS